VVEDIAYNARALGLMLGKLGSDVDFAVDGSAALGRLAAGSYRAVFLDCDLPGIGGVDVARSFRASEAPGRRTLIVATTALSTVEDQDACLAAGMDAFLAKPITPEKLRRVLEGQIGTVPPPAPEPNPDPGPVLNLEMIRHLSDGSTESLRLELAKFIASLDEAMLGVAGAMAWGSRPALASSAHRLLSHARMVGATALAESAADIQDYASVLTDTELAQDVATLGRRAAELRKVLESVAATTTPSR
jgi:CheY-like chemotaxis protein